VQRLPHLPGLSFRRRIAGMHRASKWLMAAANFPYGRIRLILLEFRPLRGENGFLD
jgi:hypothetical protein